MHSIYDQLFHYEHFGQVSVDVKKQEEEEIESFFDTHQNNFQQLLSTERILLGHASLEPRFWCFNNNFSTTRYTSLVQQQIDIFQILHSIDRAVSDFKLLDSLFQFS
jgi:hypothetical protein